MFISYFIFRIPLQITSLLFFLILVLFFIIFGKNNNVGKVLLVLWLAFILVFFYFNGDILTSKVYPGDYLFVGRYLVINYDFYIFFFFFLG